MFPSYWRHMGWGDIGAGPGGVIHYAYAQGTTSDAGDIYYTRSTDNGATWSTAIRLNADSGTRLQWQPSLSVSPAGHVFVSWYDARNTSGTAYERWGRVSNDNGLTWQADDVISDAPSPLPLQPDPNVNTCYTGDYDRSFADGNAFFTAWVDGRVAVNGVPQQDVFLDRITDVPLHLTLTATGYKQKGLQVADLSWTSAIPGGYVDIKRDSAMIITVPPTTGPTQTTSRGQGQQGFLRVPSLLRRNDRLLQPSDGQIREIRNGPRKREKLDGWAVKRRGDYGEFSERRNRRG